MRVVTFTRYSVIEVITITPVFLFTVLNFLRTLTASCSENNFIINALSKSYTVKKRKNKKKKYGSMRLTPTQHLRLLTTLALPIRCC